MSIIQRLMCSICLLIGWFFLAFGCISEHYRTYFLISDKLPDKIRYNWHLILWLVVEEKLNRSFFLTFFPILSLIFFLALSRIFFLVSSPAMATVQMQCADCGYVLVLLLYVRTLLNRTAFYGATGTTRQNWSNVWYGRFRLSCKRFYNFFLSFFIANSRRMRRELSPYARLNDYERQPVFA